MNPVPRWRIVAGGLVLAALLFFAILFSPAYLRNMSLQNYVDEITHRVGNDKATDEDLRSLVLKKAHVLGIPLTEDNVHVFRSSESVRIDVRYSVNVHAPLYTVDLHFYPGAGSR